MADRAPSSSHSPSEHFSASTSGLQGQGPDGSGSGSGSGATGKKGSKRGARACEGLSAPCARCQHSGSVCTFDRPASTVVDDAGLERLSVIEATLATSERRMNTIIEYLGEIASRLPSKHHATAAASPNNHTSPSSHLGLSSLISSSLNPPPPTTTLPPIPYTPHSGSAMPTFSAPASNSSGGQTQTPPAAIPLAPPIIPALDHRSQSSSQTSFTPRLSSNTGTSSSSSAHSNSPNGLATMYRPQPPIDRFASSVHTPIQALADAAERMLDSLQPSDKEGLDLDLDNELDSVVSMRQGGGSSSSGGGSGERRKRDGGEEVRSEGGERGREGERLGVGQGLGGMGSRKRPRLATPLPTIAPPRDQFDLVAKGLISDREARAWVLLWYKELWPFCAILDPAFDTYDSLRRRSAFLLNTVIYTAARTSGGNSPPSSELISAAEETRIFAQNLIFETAPQLEVIQALILMACYHDDPYCLSGYALRMALSARMDGTFEQIEAHGWEKDDQTARHLIAQLRCWLYLVFLEFKHSASTGRLILIHPDDAQKVDSNCEKILRSPFAITTDRRTVANLRNVLNQRIMLRTSSRFELVDQNYSEHVRYFRVTQMVLREWFEVNDAAMGAMDPSPLSWSRRSHYRHVQDAILFLACSVFKQSLLDPNAPPAVLEIAQEALRAARTSIQTVIQSPAYYESIRFSGYLTRVDLTFACLLCLKLAQTPSCQDLPEAEDIADDVERIAEILLICSGSKRHAAVLRIAKEQFIAKMHPQRPAPPTSEQPSLVSPWSNPQAAPGSLALLPGENEIDWDAFKFELESSDLLPDWTPSAPIAVESNWLDMFNQA